MHTLHSRKLTSSVLSGNSEFHRNRQWHPERYGLCRDAWLRKNVFTGTLSLGSGTANDEHKENEPFNREGIESNP